MNNEEKLQKYKEARKQLACLPNDKIILWITEKDEWLKEYAKDITVRIIKDKFMPPNVEFMLGEKPITPEPIDYTELGAQEIEIDIDKDLVTGKFVDKKIFKGEKWW